MDSRFDDLLNTVITQKGQGIYGFFDVMFSFLYRRTDFFYEMAPGENMGFFPTQAEAIVCGYFRKYQQLHYKERVPKRNIDPKVIEEYMKSKEKEKQEKKEVIDKINKQSKEDAKKEETKKEEKKPETKTTTQQDKEKEKEKNNKDNSSSNKIETSNPLNMTKEELKGPVENKPTSISTYNGDKCEDYNWSQGVGDVTIQFALKQKINKKMLKVDMTVNHLKIVIQGMDKPLIDDDFCEKIIPDDSNWSIEDGQSIIFFLEKATEIIWKSAFKGGKEIDTKTVDNSKRIDEFDSETQAALNKIVYEQHRKRN